jgi:hypothetical protein
MQNEFLKSSTDFLGKRLVETGQFCKKEVGDQKKSFAYKAACISLYTPVILLFLGFILFPLCHSDGGDMRFFILMIGGFLQFLVSLIAFILSVIGIVGGYKHRSAQIMYMSIIGFVFNCGLLLYYSQPIYQLICKFA